MGRFLIVVNYGATQGQCYVPIPFEVRGQRAVLINQLGDDRFERDGNDLAARGLYVDLPAWGYYVFEVLIMR